PASVIKDAGDGPDVTNGAEICATVRWREEPGFGITGGRGVGIVTKPGIGVALGEPAINPVPREMIRNCILEIVGERAGNGLHVEISVPRGEEIARKTLNARLGIVGGISILGTTGIVVPYSTEAYKASVSQSLDVARAAGCEEVVLTTGRRTERYAQREVNLPEEAFIQTGDFMGHALRECATRGIRKANIWAMIGKLAKIASGNFQTHVSNSQVDPHLLATISRRCGADAYVASEVQKANTARHALEIMSAAGITGAWDALCQLAADRCHAYVDGALAVTCLMVDFDGSILGRSTCE
ncbi:MAG: cobalt-precorrin-5B (C(1))-methyltransferase, partial [Chloroflexi bacterium]|nr:cobalt-precorrin-5B (C(1))-methyltransferase [Chloroflexota bacterium]